MTLSPLSRGATIVLLAFVGLTLISLSQFGDAFESVLYASYSFAMPFIFAAMILGGVYFGAKHLLTS
ncbi:MAG: hypothetical protein ACLFNC_05415 [Halodesulfurarchaeum sp.]